MISEEILNQMEIFKDESRKLTRNKYYCATLDSFIAVTDNDTVPGLLQKIYDSGYDKGVNEGKRTRSNELKRLLNNEDLDY